MTTVVGDWQWNIWELDPKTGKPCKWHGMIRDPKGAFAWMDQQPRGRQGYVVNNVPPTVKGQTRITTVVRATSDKEFEDQGVKPIASFPKHVPAPAPQKRVSVPAFTNKSQPVRPVQPKVTDTKETKALKQDAKVLLDQHKADEAEELAQEES